MNTFLYVTQHSFFVFVFFSAMVQRSQIVIWRFLMVHGGQSVKRGPHNAAVLREEFAASCCYDTALLNYKSTKWPDMTWQRTGRLSRVRGRQPLTGRSLTVWNVCMIDLYHSRFISIFCAHFSLEDDSQP